MDNHLEPFKFKDSQSFELWLKNNLDHRGIFLLFDKTKKTTLSPNEALDIALCYGWIDGVMKRIDDVYYIKYFAKRSPKSIWSTKNKNRVEELIKLGFVTIHGTKAIEIAKSNGQWDKADLPANDFSLDGFVELLEPFEIAYHNYIHMSLSTQKIFAYHYFDAKKEETRQRRLTWIIDRLNQNQGPM
jgi:uncharacterized protein YdeI (YjbR/CyaY-like superfamily)